MSCTTITSETDCLRAAFRPRCLLFPITGRALSNRIPASRGSTLPPPRLYAATGSYPISPEDIQSSGQATQSAAKSVGKVLVVDDNVDLADMVQILLTANGLETIVAYSGAEALDVLAAHPEICSVVSDVVMPGMSGIDLADRISERYPTVKIIFVSGFVAPAVSHGLALKHMLLAKPYRIEHLLTLLQSPT